MNAERSELRNALVWSGVKVARSLRSAPAQKAVVGQLDARISARGWVGGEDVGVVVVVVNLEVEERGSRYWCSEANRAVERAFRDCGAFSKRMSM